MWNIANEHANENSFEQIFASLKLIKYYKEALEILCNHSIHNHLHFYKIDNNSISYIFHKNLYGTVKITLKFLIYLSLALL